MDSDRSGHAADNSALAQIEARSDLSTAVVVFCGLLRTEHGFAIGQSEAHDSLRAIEAIGVDDRERVRSALRLVCCGTFPQTLAFDRVFDAFFVAARSGIPQPALASRHTRPGREKPGAEDTIPRGSRPKQTEDDHDEGQSTAGSRQPDRDAVGEATEWQMLRARYSPAAGRGSPLVVDIARLDEMRVAADRLIRSVRRGRTRRWKAMARGSRFDIRRTLRGSLETGGDPVALRFLGHPLRNPRFVMLLDGSRSMMDHSAAVVTFAAALSDRAPRTSIFFFSTALRDVTTDLQTVVRIGVQPAHLGEAWGGGTKIGANLTRFLDEYGGRLLSRETLVIISSDGLDVGDVPQLANAMREIDRRCAGIVWLNPHAATPGFSPAARGMHSALPFITLLSSANDAIGFSRLADRIAQTSRIQGRH